MESEPDSMMWTRNVSVAYHDSLLGDYEFGFEDQMSPWVL